MIQDLEEMRKLDKKPMWLSYRRKMFKELPEEWAKVKKKNRL